MSLFCSLSLIKEVKTSLTPRSNTNPLISEVSSSIKFNSPKPITEDFKFTFNPITSRLKTGSGQ